MKTGRLIIGVSLVAVLLVGLFAAIKHFRGRTPEAGSSDRGPEPVSVEDMRKLQGPGRDFSKSNSVTIVLGKEQPDDGIGHLAEEPDGRTTVENVDGVVCRHLNRRQEGKHFGYVYFSIDPTFKSQGLTTAQIDVEYMVRSPSVIRLQYDAKAEDKPKPYKSVPMVEGERVNYGNRIACASSITGIRYTARRRWL